MFYSCIYCAHSRVHVCRIMITSGSKVLMSQMRNFLRVLIKNFCQIIHFILEFRLNSSLREKFLWSKYIKIVGHLYVLEQFKENFYLFLLV